MDKFVGIDLGTTYSVVAYINVDGKPEVIKNEHEHALTPSVVYLGKGTPIVGDEAKERQANGEVEVASFFKRSMGDPNFLLTFHERDYTPTDLSALVLGYLKAQAEHFLGGTVTDAVITVPAYFRDVQRKATIEAGRQAGLNVHKIISEPTAAALAYGLRPSQQEQRFLVYDLGGGTFDVSLVLSTPTELRVIATDGDYNLGGKDWDDRLISYLAVQFENEFGVELYGDDVNALRVEAEQLKRSLSSRQRVDVRVQAAGHVGTYTVARELFEDLTKDLMERTQVLTERVLEEVGLSWRDLSGVLPVGGSTRMPMVSDYIKRMSGKPPMGGIHQDEAVALGAVVQAAMEMEQMAGARSPTYHLAGRKATFDVIAHSLGMIAESEDRSRYVNSIHIRKNSPIPAKETQHYQMKVRRGGDSELEVFLTQGETEDPEQCSYLGRYVFSGFPSVRGGTALLDVTYEYDKNGTVHISALEHESGKPLTLTVHPVPDDVPARFAGRPTYIAEEYESMTVYMAFDVSGSMCGKPIGEAQRAAERFVSQCNLSSAAIGLISFSDWVNVDQPATHDQQQISRAISNLRCGSTGGGNDTDPFDDIYHLLSNVSGRRYAIVLADGVWSHQEEAVRRAKQCHEIGIEVIAIGFGGADHLFLNRIASSSEQSFFTSMNQLADTFSTIAQKLSRRVGK